MEARPLQFVRLDFAAVIELLIAALTQLLWRALIIFYAASAASAKAPRQQDHHQAPIRW